MPRDQLSVAFVKLTDSVQLRGVAPLILVAFGQHGVVVRVFSQVVFGDLSGNFGIVGMFHFDFDALFQLLGVKVRIWAASGLATRDFIFQKCSNYLVRSSHLL